MQFETVQSGPPFHEMERTTAQMPSGTGTQAESVSLTVDWDYTQLADSYVFRPGYAEAAIDALLATAGAGATRLAIDLGAGTGHLTVPLAERGCNVVALEPNGMMRRHGIARTSHYPNVRWVVGRMEQTGLPAGVCSLATCGSSFGVADRGATLREVSRILEPEGWFACMWNHRDLDEPLQREIETYIKANIPGYRYGVRRDDQASVIAESGLFGRVHVLAFPIRHRLAKAAWIDAWRSHATLQRQAGDQFTRIVTGIGAIVDASGDDVVEIPYTTRVWMARRKPDEAPLPI